MKPTVARRSDACDHMKSTSVDWTNIDPKDREKNFRRRSTRYGWVI